MSRSITNFGMAAPWFYGPLYQAEGKTEPMVPCRRHSVNGACLDWFCTRSVPGNGWKKGNWCFLCRERVTIL